MILQYIANAIVGGCIYSIVALGFGIIYHTTKVFHIAHAVTFTVSAYVLFTLHSIYELNLVVSFFIAIVFSGCFGICLDHFIYNPLNNRNAASGIMFISSLGIYTASINIISLIFGDKSVQIINVIWKSYSFGSATLTFIQMIQIIISSLVIIVLLTLLKYTTWGKLIKAHVENPALLKALGVNTKRVRSWIYFVGSILAGIGGCLVALDVGVEPYASMELVLIIIVAVIIGGVKRIEGAIFGAFTLSSLENISVWLFSEKWSSVTVFLILVLFLLIKPKGILGRKVRLEES